MQKIFDSQTTDDPNIFGEILRSYCFVENVNGEHFVGCYSTFDLKPSFKPVDKKDVLWEEFFDYIGRDSDPKTVQVYTDGKEITLGWYWEGDGTLVIKEKDRVAINTDCKCDYTWAWVGEEEYR